MPERRRAIRRFVVGLVVGLVTGGLAGCPLPPAEPTSNTAELAPAIQIVVSERGPRGARLVVVDEHGDRVAELTPTPQGASRDNSPAMSPDGRWVVFASTRGRDAESTSIWVTPAQPGGEPSRLTGGAEIGRDPTWSPDSKSIVFASDRAGTFDLWRLPLAFTGTDVRTAGPAERLTTAPGQELTPSVAADGRIAYAALTSGDRGGWQSRIELRAVDGTITKLTAGPVDGTPAWSPDGALIAYAAPALARGDVDIFAVGAEGGAPRVLIDEIDTDQTGPVWSRDGRWLFATSIYRAQQDGRPLLASITYVDRRAATPTVRILRDRVGAVSRLGVALGAGPLDAATLAANPGYRDELVRILARAVEKAEPPAPAPKP